MMLIVFSRTLILYVLIVVVIRMMGKRQIAEMQPFELVITIMIADLAAIPMQNMGVPLINGIIPIITLLSVQVFISYMSLKSEKVREIICGKPSLIIDKGRIVESELRKLRIDMNDLLEQLRVQNYLNISDIEFAILETNGKISITPRAEKRGVTVSDLGIKAEREELPITLIVDGKLFSTNLKNSGYDKNWLLKKLEKNKIKRIEDAFFAFIASDGVFHAQSKEITAQKEERL
ncbi:MAG: DUF421 domain-containing protein [Clostridiales bacterium]|nr:DUF421 domain-containing protein [Clostridiales bacterium]